MGIRGLSSFLNKEFRHWKTVNYKKKVIIDGNSVCYSLYKDIPWALGGEYDKFASIVEDFFKSHPFHNPIVVLDGSRVDDSKDETARERRRDAMTDLSKFQKSKRIDTSSTGKGNLLPSLTLITFVATLEKLEIEYYVADGESDEDIAALADEHECPVLSADSDFYIFNLQSGFINFKRLLSSSRPLYYIKDFIKQFKLEAYELCLMIPAFFGNDFIDSEVQEKGKLKYGMFMEGLSKCKTCSHFKRTSNGRKIKSSNFQLALQFYSYLEVSTAYSDQPQLLHNKYKEGKIFFFDAFLRGACLQPKIVERIESDAAWRASRPIRQQIYHILKLDKVTETIHQNGKAELTSETVDLTSETVTPVSLVIPASIENVPIEAVLYSLLQVETIPDEFTQLGNEWKLPIAATCFWYKEISNPRFLLALLLSFLTLHNDITREKFGYPQITEDKKPTYLEAFHAYSKWQCIYSDAISLNCLAAEPMHTTSPAQLYSGEIAMGYVLNVKLLQVYTEPTMELLPSFWIIVAGTPLPTDNFLC